ncbi:uncharacterized protein F4807DRAFT_460400 [Annulohypoxylon truncatum]|uniref:uncharacterized protein n=1 Tax=Annulohypoxylon truncatum TaxID=327061 RepID=UPI002008633E|nr:uncharacterized protein F4807DRAFT_460400 [Annulohypoxylon truncatum]KAI1209652.1 hypothetical protein F4807DRAFT_460400 [Annulohypoxylon truncatum]
MAFRVTPSPAGASIIRVLVALAPVALPAAYLLYVKRSLAKKTVVSEAQISPLGSLLLDEKSEDDDGDVIPQDVVANAEEFVIARERVTSVPIPVADLRPELAELGGLLKAYLSATMRAFAWTPQALVMARMGSALADPEAYRRTFEARYLGECAFEIGDRVCGVYVVRGRRGGRAVLGLSPPPGWRGPVVAGALNVGFDLTAGGDEVKFVNETVLWRRVGEKPTLLEGSVGRWLHTLMASWLVVKGIEAVADGNVRNI